MSEYTFEFYTQKNINYAISKSCSSVITDAFRNDIVVEVLGNNVDSLADKDLPKIYNYEELSHKINTFESKVEAGARKLHLAFLKDNRRLLILMKQSDQPVAIASLIFPPYSTEKVTFSFSYLLSRIKYLVLKVFYKLKDWPEVPELREFSEEMQWAHNNTGLGNTKRTIEEMKECSVEKLKDVGYPIDYGYYLSVFAVRTDQHGKGVGRILMKKVIEHVESVAIPPPDLGPNVLPKIVLQSAPTARGFYENLGFRCSSAASHMLNGVEITHSAYFRNLKDS